MLPAFEWDPDKARRNFRKHRIHFAEAVTVFHDPWARFREDPAHSGAEERGKIIGYSNYNRLLAVIFTERYESIRIISAWKATTSEKAAYGEDHR